MTDKDRTVISASEVKTSPLSRSEQRKKNRIEHRGQKKSDSSALGAAPEGLISRIVNFFTEAKEELMRVVWPTRKETFDSTWRLLILVTLVGIYLGLVDSVLSRLLGLLV